jgi:hypothetical protein
MANDIKKKGNLLININNPNNNSKIIYNTKFKFNLFNINSLLIKKKYIKYLFLSKICINFNNNTYNFNMNYILNYNNIFYIDYINNNDDDELLINLNFHYFMSEDINIIPFQNKKIIFIFKNIKYIESCKIIIEYTFLLHNKIINYSNLNKIIYIKNLNNFNIDLINSENNNNNYYQEINLSKYFLSENSSQGLFLSLYNNNENINYLNINLEIKNDNNINNYNFINYDEDIFIKFSKKINNKMYYIGFYPYDSYENINKNKCINLNIYNKLIINCKTHSSEIINKNSKIIIYILSFNSFTYNSVN